MELVTIADVGNLATYHVGDEAMLEANITGLRALAPETRFTVISGSPEWTAKRYDVAAISPIGFPSVTEGTEEDRERLLSNAIERVQQRRFEAPTDKESSLLTLIRAVDGSDGVLISGGGNLCSSWPQHLYERVALIRIAHLLNKPIVVTGQTIGPDLSELERSHLESALPLAKIVIARERSTYQLALSIGVDPDALFYCLDDAFFMATEAAPPRLPELAAGSDEWVAITLAPFWDPAQEETEIQSFAASLDRVVDALEMPLVFLPHVAGGDGIVADKEVARRVVARMERADYTRVLDIQQARETCNATRMSSLVISNRYHPIVFAMSAAVPAIGIYSHEYTRMKIEGALSHAELEANAIEHNAATGEGLAQKAAEVWRMRKQQGEQMTSMRPAWANTERHRWRRIAEAFGLGLRNDVKPTRGN